MSSDSNSILLVIFIYFIFVTIFLTILWRMALALDRISNQLIDVAKDLKKLSPSDSKAEKKEPRRK
jgi:hypothetical protein